MDDLDDMQFALEDYDDSRFNKHVPLDKQPMREQLVTAVQDIVTALDAIFINFVLGPTELDNRTKHKIIVVDTGSHALKQWRCGDDIHLVCLTNTTSTTFWNVVKEELELNEDLKAPKEHSLDISDEKILQSHSQMLMPRRTRAGRVVSLCQNPEARCKVYLNWTRMPSDFYETMQLYKPLQPIQTPSSNYPGPSARHFNKVCDMQALGPLVSHFDDANELIISPYFITAYCSIRRWARCKGLFGPQLGYLDNEIIIWAIYGAYMEPRPTATTQMKEWNETLLVRVLLRLRSAFATAAVANPPSAPQRLGDASSEIRTPSGHLTTSHLQPGAKQAIRAAITTETELGRWDDNIVSLSRSGFRDFIKEYSGRLLLAESEIWQQAPNKAARFRRQFWEHFQSFESHLREWKDARGAGSFYLRIWPERLSEKGNTDRTIYAISVGRYPAVEGVDVEPLEECVVPIADHLNDTAPAYATEDGWMQVRPATARDFARLVPEHNVDKQRSAASALAAFDKSAERVSIPSAGTRFRTAGQALGRLRHDPAHQGIEYDVGHEDRFAGLLWTPLEEWGGKATEEEDFIPEHRVRQLRRRKDEKVVWDREKRVDLLG